MLDEVNSKPPARIAVAGASGPAGELAGLLAGDTEGAVSVLERGAADIVGSTTLVLVVDAWPLPDRDEETLRAAERAGVHRVAALLGSEVPAHRDEVPYVLATDCVKAATASGALDPLVERIAIGAKGDAYRLARALPHFREQSSRAIIRHYARLNGLVGAAAIVPGADLPVLTINQLRMVARLAGAQGIVLDARRLVELAAVVGASLGMRGVARAALSLLPGPGRAIKGGVALSGTTAIGEAALRRFRAEAAGR